MHIVVFIVPVDCCSRLSTWHCRDAQKCQKWWVDFGVGYLVQLIGYCWPNLRECVPHGLGYGITKFCKNIWDISCDTAPWSRGGQRPPWLADGERHAGKMCFSSNDLKVTAGTGLWYSQYGRCCCLFLVVPPAPCDIICPNITWRAIIGALLSECRAECRLVYDLCNYWVPQKLLISP